MLNAYVILSVLFIFTKPKISTANFLVDFFVRKMHAELLGFYAVMHALSYCTRSVTSQIKVAMTKVLTCGSFSGRDSSAHFRKNLSFLLIMKRCSCFCKHLSAV